MYDDQDPTQTQTNGAASGETTTAGAAPIIVDAAPEKLDDALIQQPQARESILAECKRIAETVVADARESILAECKAIANQSATDVTQGVQMLLKSFEPMLTRAKELLGFKTATPAAETTDAHAIVKGDKVKVWLDAARKNFYTGVVDQVHDEGHSFDVVLSTGQVAHVQAAGLELDELAQ